MLASLARKFFGSANDRLIRSMQRDVTAINALEQEMAKLSDEALQNQTNLLRARLAKGETLDDILHQAFATVREASKRVMNMRHFDVQLIGGMVLHRGMISEMKTGEGKTLVATLAAYLNALKGDGVHIVTVNDYLARRDAIWMGKLYNFLGLSVGIVTHSSSDEQRKQAYNADITYCTNNELGFDYLRDNMKYALEQMVQRPFNFAIVDEVDSILVDEARTPLIISGPTEDNSDLYTKVNTIVPRLVETDFEIDEKARSVTLTEEGTAHVEALMMEDGLLTPPSALYDIENVALVHHINQALRAHKIFQRDVDYIVKDNKVIIIDEFTGRMMEGRRYSDGQHQALEAKEHVRIQNENQTLASITFQNYFRLYPKLAGMTGTAMTEANEFHDIYKLEVVEVPTNIPVARTDWHDEVYRTEREKINAVIEQVRECHERGQPVLVGTVSIEKSEQLSGMLKAAHIPHQVLNARYHEKEAFIIAQAGRPGAVTIATNMAGRGTDIMLGGNPDMLLAEEIGGEADEAKHGVIAERIREQVAKDKEKVRAAGGLFVIGTERHESRRIDNQLRGRSGRQGDPGASKFYLSLQDDLMRIFGGNRIEGMLQKMGMKEGDALSAGMMNRTIERAQHKVEARNYDMRKNLLKFDDVMNDQRKVIYEQRIELMRSNDVSETVVEMRDEVLAQQVATHIPANSYAEKWQTQELEREIYRLFGIHADVSLWAREEGIAEEEIAARLREHVALVFEEKEQNYGPEIMRNAEKRVLLQTLDGLWKDHLHALDNIRRGVHLRAYGQRDPLNEYKQEAFSHFEYMLGALRELVTQRLAHLQIQFELPEGMEHRPAQKMVESRVDPAMQGLAEDDEGVEIPHLPLRTHIAPEARDPANPQTWGKVGRNDPCPCGSDKKYKHCHGVLS